MSVEEDSAPTPAFAELDEFDETLFKASIRVTLSSCLRFKDDDESAAEEVIVDGTEDAILACGKQSRKANLKQETGKATYLLLMCSMLLLPCTYFQDDYVLGEVHVAT